MSSQNNGFSEYIGKQGYFQPYTLTIYADKISMCDKSLNLTFDLSMSKIEKINEIIINGVSFVKKSEV